MAKYRIDEKGWDTYTGLVGLVPFENGVSTRDLTELEITRIASNLRLVNEDDEQIGPGVDMTGYKNVSAYSEAPLKRGNESVVETPVEEVKEEVVKDDTSDVHIYTREELEEIADKGGIAGIRKVAAEFGVKGVQIAGLINEILDAQGKDV